MWFPYLTNCLHNLHTKYRVCFQISFTVLRNLIILQILKILKIICFFFQIRFSKLNKENLPLKSSSMAIRSLSKVFTFPLIVVI